MDASPAPSPVPLPPIIAADLGPLAGDFSAALIPKAIAIAATALGATGVGHVFGPSTDTAIVTYTFTAALYGVSIGLTWLRTKMAARKLVAAAATGNPKADPTDPLTERKVSLAVKDPAMPMIKAAPAAA